MQKLDNKAIAILVPHYIGGGAEKITDTLFGPLMREYGYTVHLISVEMNENTRPRAKAMGYVVNDLSDVGPDFRTAKATEAIIQVIKNSNARHVVYVGMAPTEVERYRNELPGRNIIFHLHTMPAWEPIVRLVGTRRYVLTLESPWRYIEWFFVKYLKEKWFKVYTHRMAKHYRRVYKQVDSVIALTDSYRRTLNKMVGLSANDPNSKISTIYNPFDPTDLLPLAEIPKQKEVLYLGRFHNIEKGIDHLLRAWKFVSKNHPDWKLKLVGKGPDKAYLEYMIEALHIQRVEFYDYSNSIADHLSTASILCMTSNMEGWPTVLSEAMSAGVVPIAFNCSGGVEEMLRDGRGILVKPGKDYKYARELDRLMSNYQNERAKRLNLYPSFVKSFSVDNAVKQFLKLLYD